MNFFLFFAFIILFVVSSVSAQDTFSICAVDLVTGEVGSAGASCIGGSKIISDVHPGVGVIHTQAAYLAANQNTAKTQMNTGKSPQEIIDFLKANDSQGNSTIRQYGVVDVKNGGRSAAYTGSNCSVFANHITSPTYAIQGNILLGKQVLDSMQARFSREKGDLACKLMAAMQGAKMIGADTRCKPYNTSSLSSFLRVAKPTDIGGNYYIDLEVTGLNMPYKEPIDSLQKLFNKVHNCNVTSIEQEFVKSFTVTVYPNPVTNVSVLKIDNLQPSEYKLEVYTKTGQLILTADLKSKTEYKFKKEIFASGMYFYKITSVHGKAIRGKIVVL